MSWFIFALIATVGWGVADLFYKKGTDEHDRYSHLKIAVWVGLVMGAASFLLMLFSDRGFGFSELFTDIVKYSPAALGYIFSMVIGYAGLRYLEISIISPVQNASGALSAIVIMVFFLVKGKISSIGEELSALDVIGTVIIAFGVIALAVVENRLSADKTVGNKHRIGALALLFPFLYCLFDTVGTAADGIILDDKTGLGLGEIDVLIVYGLTFFLAAVVAYIYLCIKEKKLYNIFSKKEASEKGVAALCEEFGQVFYVYAMAAKPVLAAPMIASYCIVSVILSRVFLKEKLQKSQYIFVGLVITGIILLGISEGLAG